MLSGAHGPGASDPRADAQRRGPRVAGARERDGEGIG
jgi:hypothetical protein